jgi:pimeloyl-ACP methyl ester carboxylesterase
MARGAAMSLMQAERREVVAGGALVRYYAEGDDPPLLLLHGLGGAAVVWYRNLPKLARSYTVLAPDLWGPGRHGGKRFTLDVGVRFVADFLDAVGHRSAHLVGSSLGGVIAGFTAVREPSHVRSLTLVDSAGLGREIALSQRLLSLPFVGDIAFRPKVHRVRQMLARF